MRQLISIISVLLIIALNSAHASIPMQSGQNTVEDTSWLGMLPGFLSIPEGTVGIFKRGGFIEGVWSPGIYNYMPVYTDYVLINTRPQVDVLTNIRCGTRDGLNITFSNVSIFNTLSKDDAWDIVSRFGQDYDYYLIVQPAKQAIMELCAEKTAQQLYLDEYSSLNEYLTTKLKKEQDRLGSRLAITLVTVTKPVLPENIQKNYQRIVEEKTRIIAVEEERKRKIKEEDTRQTLKSQEAETEKKLAIMQLEKQISEAEKLAELSKIEVEKEKSKKQNEAEADYFAKTKAAEAEAESVKLRGQAKAKEILEIGKAEAESTSALAAANQKLLTDNYVMIKYAEAFQKSKHLKLIFFGEKIPHSIVPLVDLKGIKSMLFDGEKGQNMMDPIDSTGS